MNAVVCEDTDNGKVKQKPHLEFPNEAFKCLIVKELK